MSGGKVVSWLVVLFIVGLFSLMVRMVAFPTPEEVRMRARNQYNNAYPCINGVRYIRTGRNGVENVTPMIDPKTLQPQLCNSEEL